MQGKDCSYREERWRLSRLKKGSRYRMMFHSSLQTHFLNWVIFPSLLEWDLVGELEWVRAWVWVWEWDRVVFRWIPGPQ